MEDSGVFSYVLENIGLATVSVVSTGAVLYYMMSKSQPRGAFPVSLDNQSREIEENGARCSQYATDGKLIEYFHEDAKTCYESILRGKRVSNDGPCLGSRTGPNKEYVWLSYSEVITSAHQLGSAFVKHGQAASNDTFIGIFATNCAEWVITDLACNTFSMVSVPLYDTLGPDVCSYIINQTGIGLVVCDKAWRAENLLTTAAKMSTLKVIVVIEDITERIAELAKETGIEVVPFQDMVKLGAENLLDPVPPTPEDLITICYTSGTTGDPKGVMLTHRNFISNVSSVLAQLPESDAGTSDDVYISYLPLAHMFERICQCWMYQHGARVGFFRGDVKLLTEDMQALRPTTFPTVPRLLNRIYDKVLMSTRDSWIKSWLFNLALRKKTELLKSGIHTQSTIWDTLVFGKIQKLLGGRVRFCIIGSAPVSGEVLNFARCAFGCTMSEGYGQTECTAGATLTLKPEHATEMVGPPLSCNMIKLADVPDMNYFAKDNEGEVCIKGNNVMKGYFKQPEKTNETIDEDGWLHTGDIGCWLPNGVLKIIDRKKHIFKLSQGEYLAPEKIEAVYMRSPLVVQAFVDGKSIETFAVGIIVPDPDTVPQWAKKHGIKDSDMTSLCKNEKLKKAIFDDIIQHGKDAGLKGFEQVRHIHLHDELFTPENGFLTPTFKSKRPVLRKHFSEVIDNLYSQEQN